MESPGCSSTVVLGRARPSRISTAGRTWRGEAERRRRRSGMEVPPFQDSGWFPAYTKTTAADCRHESVVCPAVVHEGDGAGVRGLCSAGGSRADRMWVTSLMTSKHNATTGCKQWIRHQIRPAG